MPIDLKKIAGLGAVVAALSAGPAAAQGLTGWDLDEDGAVSQDEFSQTWTSSFEDSGTPFSALDTDNDGMINESEYNAGVFNFYDRNRDGVMDEQEFEAFSRDNDGGFWMR